MLADLDVVVLDAPESVAVGRAGELALPEAGQDGVETCRMRPSPESLQRIMPLECPHGEPQDLLQPAILGSSTDRSKRHKKGVVVDFIESGADGVGGSVAGAVTALLQGGVVAAAKDKLLATFVLLDLASERA